MEVFNEGAFWESHEILEGPWRAGGSRFYHGLILFASAFVHVERDNPHGIRAQLAKAEEALEPYAPHYLGVDVGDLLERCRRGRRAVGEREGESEEGGVEGGEGWEGWRAVVPPPRLVLDPARLRGDEPELGRSGG